MIETEMRTVISKEETNVVYAKYFVLVCGIRATDNVTILELRSYAGMDLVDLVQEPFDCRVRQHRLERDYEALKAAQLEAWVEAYRHA